MIRIFTDGGCSGNPGPGGWAFAAFQDGENIASSSGGDKDTTNNKMELTAVINALEFAINCNYSVVEILTDSQYVKNGITQWIFNWKAKGWKTSGGGAVKNKEYWERLDMLNNRVKVQWTWVKGHAGIEGNELCDKLVRAETAKYSL